MASLLRLICGMCGIAGIAYRERGRSGPEPLVRRMCAALKHRGPDDEGVWVAGGVGLGMRRLSIIDLAGSQQPIFNEDHTKAIVFNGEIYNYQELRRGLVARGHVLRTHGDTDTALHLYDELGVECVTRLPALFAFANSDPAAPTLPFARPPLRPTPL